MPRQPRGRHHYEPLRRVEVVFPALVNNPQITVFFGVRVRQYTIDLVNFE